jgi:demethylmenaquinone methyltransferase/2-methoxy-6-polyprenyl-1,4-benzoquinol methylase
MSLLKEDKSKLVKKVFNKVYEKYDLMNDIMSLGTHRIWKKNLISWIKPTEESNIIDVASGTGDIAKLCSYSTRNKCKLTCVEPNEKMLDEGKKKLAHLNNLKWVLSSAENLPFKDNTFDYYIISFGIRNVSNLKKSLREAHRVLKKGGRFFCLEFSKVENEILRDIYKKYSQVIPSIGKFVIGEKMPYDYLVQSIERFHDQENFSKILEENGISNVEYRNLANGIAAIHSGWKIE